VRRALPAALLLSMLAGTGSAWAHVPLTLGATEGPAGGTVKRWRLDAYPDAAIPYRVNPQQPPGANPIGPPGTTTAQVLDAVLGAFQAWEGLPGAAVRFRFAGTTTGTNALDGVNVVTFSPQGFSFPPAFPGGIFPLIFSALGPGPVSVPGGPTLVAEFAGEILDVDLVVNPAGDFVIAAAPPPPDSFDLPGILVHEIGHALGLDHTGIQGATMYGFFTLSGGFFNRRVERDDAVGTATLYPSAAFVPATGRIAGTVRRPGGAPVFGAHVVALEAATGIVVTSAISGLVATQPDGLPLRYAQGEGGFLLTGLAPGTYDVVAEPLDGPGEPFLGGVFGTASGGTSFVEKDFLPSLPLSVSVAAGQTVSGLQPTVPARGPTAPNLAAASFAAPPGEPFVAPAPLAPGTGALLSLPHGVNLVSGGGLVPGAVVDVVGGAVVLGSATVRETDILFPIDALAGIPEGARMIRAVTPSGTSVFPGGVVVAAPDAGGPRLAVAPSGVVDFGSVPVGAEATRSFTVTNTGTGTLTGGATTFAPFSLVSGSPFDLGAGASQTVVVRVVPVATGPVAATLNVTSTGGQAARGLAATGVADAVTVTVVRAGTGTGTVTSAPPGIACGATCAAAFPAGQTVTLTAAAAPGSVFAGWSGPCAGTDPCSVVPTAATVVTAEFVAVVLTATVRGSAEGTITVTPPGLACLATCVVPFDAGAVVTLQAVGGGGGVFTAWGGACSGAAPSCTVTMATARTVTATFSRVFTDAGLEPATSVIRAAHVGDLRAAVDTLRARHGLGARAWTDPVLGAQATPVRRAHLVELRAALAEAYEAAGRPPPPFADPAITPGVTAVRALHVLELRQAVRELE
jgi:hypothetical protein